MSFGLLFALASYLPARSLAQTPSTGTVRGLLVGIDIYEDKSLPTLTGASEDAQKLADAFAEVTGAPRSNFIVLRTDPERTDVPPQRQVEAGDIVTAIKKLKQESKPEDVVFIMFSCHGEEATLDTDGAGHGSVIGTPYLCPSNGNFNDVDVRETTCLSVPKVNAILQEIPCRVLVVCYDMCRARALLTKSQVSNLVSRGPDDLAPSLVLPSRSSIKNLNTSSVLSGWVTVFACGSSQRSYEMRDRRRGLFSYYFEDGLRNAADSAGVLRLGQVFDYANAKVSEYSEGDQRPSVSDPDAVGRLVLASGRPAGNGGIFKAPTDPSASGADKAFLTGGTALFGKGDYAGAQSMFQQAWDASKQSSSDAAYWVCRCLINLDRYRSARTWATKALKLDPASGHAHWAYGTTLQDGGQTKQARAEYELAKKTEPKFMPAYLDLVQMEISKVSTVMTESGMLDSLAAAEKAVGLAAHLAPDDTDVLAGAALCSAMRIWSMHKTDYSKALNQCEAAIARDPTYDSGWRVKSLIQAFYVKDQKAAEETLLAGIDKCAPDAYTKAQLELSLASLYYSQDSTLGKRDQVAALVESAVSGYPSPAVCVDAAAFVANDHSDAAARYIDLGVKIEDTPRLELMRAYLSEQAGDDTSSEKDLKSARGMEPGDATPAAALGQFYWRRGKMADAIATYRELLRLDERLPGDAASFAHLLVLNRQFTPEALAAAKEGFDGGVWSNQFLEVFATLAAEQKAWDSYDAAAAKYQGWIHNLHTALQCSPANYEACLRHEMAVKPSSADAFQDLAANMKTEAAFAVFEDAARKNPGSGWPLLSEALLWDRANDPTKAASALQGAIKLGVDENHVGLALDVVDTLYRTATAPPYDRANPTAVPPVSDPEKRKFKAESSLATLRALAPGRAKGGVADFLIAKASAYFLVELNRRPEALERYSACFAMEKINAHYDTYADQEIFVQAGVLAGQVKDWTRLDAFDAQFAELSHSPRGELYHYVALRLSTTWIDNRPEESEAADVAMRGVVAAPKSQELSQDTVMFYAEAGQLELAEAARKRAESAGLNTMHWYSAAADYLPWQTPESRKRSVDLFQREFSIHPDNGEAHRRYGRRLEFANDLSAAREQYQIANEKSGDPEAKMALARMYGLNREHSAAEALYADATGTSPEPLYLLVRASYLIDEVHDAEHAAPMLAFLLQRVMVYQSDLPLPGLPNNSPLKPNAFKPEDGPVFLETIRAWLEGVSAVKLEAAKTTLTAMAAILERLFKNQVDYTNPKGEAQRIMITAPLWKQVDPLYPAVGALGPAHP